MPKESKGACGFDKLFTKSVPHVLEKIFFSLDYPSFKTCLEVSHMWNELLISVPFLRMGKAVFHRDIRRELFYALKDGNVGGVAKILSSGMADVNYAGKSGTYLYQAASWGHTDAVKLLLEAGAECDKGAGDGVTPLQMAAYYGHRDIVQILLDNGAAIEELYKVFYQLR